GKLEQLAEEWHRAHREREEAVRCLVDAVRRADVRVRAPDLAPHGQSIAVVQVAGQHLELEVERRLEQADLDEAAAAGRAAADEAREDALAKVRAGESVDDRESERDRRVVAVPVQPREAGE